MLATMRAPKTGFGREVVGLFALAATLGIGAVIMLDAWLAGAAVVLLGLTAATERRIAELRTALHGRDRVHGRGQAAETYAGSGRDGPVTIQPALPESRIALPMLRQWDDQATRHRIELCMEVTQGVPRVLGVTLREDTATGRDEGLRSPTFSPTIARDPWALRSNDALDPGAMSFAAAASRDPWSASVDEPREPLSTAFSVPPSRDPWGPLTAESQVSQVMPQSAPANGDPLLAIRQGLQEISGELVTSNESVDPSEAKILVVEDNPVNQMVMRQMLKQLGYATDIASNGREGVDRARAHRYLAIMMDCDMPVMDGYEATRVIRRLPEPHGATPIIAATAHALSGEREKCLAVGMNDFIAKPIERTVLAEVVGRWVRDSPARMDAA